MMRTIKFKAKRVDNGEWVFGSFLHDETLPIDDICRCMIWSNEGDGNYWDVIPETVCQFTGLLDKNGVEIYDGDEVLFVGGTCSFLICGNYGEKHEIGKTLFVECLLSGFTLREERDLGNEISNIVGNVHNYDLWNHASSLKVTGNIHDNLSHKQNI